MSHRTAILVLLCASLAGCRGGDDISDTAFWGIDTGNDDTGGTDTDPVDDTGTDTASVIEPSYWAIGGTIDIVDGAVGKENTSLTVHILGADVADELCVYSPEVLAAMPEPLPDPTLEVWGWWRFTFVDPTPPPACNLAAFPADFLVGIGMLDSLLNPALDAQTTYEYSTAAETIYGLYIQSADDAPVYVFGFAGTPANLAGTAPAVVGEVLPNGLYELTTLHYLPL